VRLAMLSGCELLIQEGNVPHAQIQRLESEVASLREELRIVTARMNRIDPHRRPQYPPIERMAILELRAMRGWSKVETARRFGIAPDTIIDGNLLPKCKDLGGQAEPGHQECSDQKENRLDDAHGEVSHNRQKRPILSPRRMDIKSPNSLTFNEYGISNRNRFKK
jgi:hypothetical protein